MQDRMPVLREKPRRSRSSRKLLTFLLLLFITLLAVLFFRSSLSKVALIEISGNSVLTAEEVGQASGIAAGSNFFGFSSNAAEKAVQQLSAVESVTVRKHFPGLVRIEVHEYPKVAYRLGSGGGMEMLLANGLIFPVSGPAAVLDKPILSGWSEDDPQLRKLCEALRTIPDKLLAEISEIKPAPTKTYEDKIKMYTRSKFEVYTTVSYLPEKLPYLDEMIERMADKEVDSGVFEMLEVNTHIPFELYYEKPAAANAGGAKTDAKPSR